IIVRNVGSDPGTGALVDGNAPAGPNVITINDPTDTDYTVSGLNPNTDYHFIIIPYNRGTDDETYNYYTDPGYPSANATTEADVDIDANNNGVASTGSPLNSGTPSLGLIGFTLESTGPVQFESVVIHLSSTTSGKFD